jgi:hypothetical protein
VGSVGAASRDSLRGALKSLTQWWLARRYTSNLGSGDICVVVSAGNSYQIAKVLKADESAIHIALYKNRYSEPPTQVDTRILTFGRIDDADGFGISHLPLSRGTFASWLPADSALASNRGGIGGLSNVAGSKRRHLRLIKLINALFRHYPPFCSDRTGKISTYCRTRGQST